MKNDEISQTLGRHGALLETAAKDVQEVKTSLLASSQESRTHRDATDRKITHLQLGTLGAIISPFIASSMHNPIKIQDIVASIIKLFS